MDNQEKNKSIKNSEIIINGRSIIDNNGNLNQEKLGQLSDTLSNNLQNALNTLNESLITKVEKLHANLVRFQSTDHTGSLNNLPMDSVAIVDLSNLVKNLPVFEISNNNGKFYFKLNDNSLFELDLNQQQNPTTQNQRLTSDNGWY